MGGKYMDWYKRTVRGASFSFRGLCGSLWLPTFTACVSVCAREVKNTDRIYNCGISGGTRGKLGVLVDQMLEVPAMLERSRLCVSQASWRTRGKAPRGAGVERGSLGPLGEVEHRLPESGVCYATGTV